MLNAPKKQVNNPLALHPWFYHVQAMLGKSPRFGRHFSGGLCACFEHMIYMYTTAMLWKVFLRRALCTPQHMINFILSTTSCSTVLSTYSKFSLIAWQSPPNFWLPPTTFVYLTYSTLIGATSYSQKGCRVKNLLLSGQNRVGRPKMGECREALRDVEKIWNLNW